MYIDSGKQLEPLPPTQVAYEKCKYTGSETCMQMPNKFPGC